VSAHAVTARSRNEAAWNERIMVVAISPVP
jgi:hypothetical protein